MITRARWRSGSVDDTRYQYVVTVAEPITAARGQEEEAARAWVAILEAVVREHPTQWFNFFDIWQGVDG